MSISQHLEQLLELIESGATAEQLKLIIEKRLAEAKDQEIQDMY